LKVLPNPPIELENAMWDLFVDFEDELKFRENFDAVGQLFATANLSAATPGLFTEISRLEQDLTWVAIESARLASRFDTKMRYTLTADPQLQQSVGTVMLSQMWHQTESPVRP
jgi:hypothetical protein